MEANVLVYAEAWGFGGIESYLMGVFRALAGKGFRFTLFTTWDWSDSRDKELEELGVERVVRFKGYRPGQIRRLREGLRSFAGLLRETRFDAVHINTMNGVGFAYAREAKRQRVPVRIVHSHNSDVGEGQKALKRGLHSILRNTLLGAETTRLACSPAAGKHMFGDVGFEVVRNGVDTERFSFSKSRRSKERNKIGISDDTILAGNPSRLAPAKNPLFQLDVFSELLKIEPSSLYVMQDGGEMDADVKEYAKKLGVEDSVLWFEPRSDIASLYSALDVMLFPSLFEGLSLASIEAQCAGLPVLASSNVSKDAAITECITFESLSAPAAAWAQKMLSAARKSDSRSGYDALVREAGFDCYQSAANLAETYRSHAGGV